MEENRPTTIFDDSSQLIEQICSHVASGGSLASLSTKLNTPFYDIIAWIEANKDRLDRYHRAVEYRDEWCKDVVLQELRILASFDIRKLYDQENNLIPVHEWPEEVAKCIESFEVTGEQGHLKKVKATSRLKAIETLMKNLGLLTPKIQIEASESLEKLIGGSWKEDEI